MNQFKQTTMKQYEMIEGSGGSLSLEERMLYAISEKIFTHSVQHERPSIEGTDAAAKACAEIAQEEIDKAVKERCIEFVDFLEKGGYQKYEGGFWAKDNEDEKKSIEELFDLFNKK